MLMMDRYAKKFSGTVDAYKVDVTKNPKAKEVRYNRYNSAWSQRS